MKNAFMFIKDFYSGMLVGHEYMYTVTFNKRVPRVLCWLVSIITLPLNLLFILWMIIFRRDEFNNDIDEIIETIEDEA